MNKINLNLLFIFSSILFSSFSFSDESIYRIDYIIFKFLPNIDSKEKFKTPEITFSDELINITDLKYPEFIKPDSLNNNLPYQNLFQDISISRVINQSNVQEESTEDQVRMSKNQVFFQNDSGVDFAMEEIVQKLKRSKNYRVIDQNSWFQEIKDQSLAPAVLIKTKIDDGDIVVGEIKAYKKRFLHLDANLYFAEESTDPVSFEKIVILKEQFKKGEFVINQINLFENEELEFLYEINHSRKLRSKELHYIDHPKFGVIFQISPTKNI
ncbi:MAG: CsiV family protein [Gammaproteobacteria bacterium]